MSNLDRAIRIAAEGHAGQVDKAGRPYILHALRVMLAQPDEPAQIAAVLHDLVEDCPGWSLERLGDEGFKADILAAIDSVTKREGEDYPAFVRRAAADPIGRRVKLADLRDNCDLARIPDATARDHQRIAKYRLAIAELEAA